MVTTYMGERSAAVRLGPDVAYATHDAILVAYFTGRTEASSLRALHEAHMALRARYPGGTVTLSLVGPGTAIPKRDVRQVAAELGRAASVGLLGEGVILAGHEFWVAMARTALRTITLLSHAMHSRSTFGDVREGALWALELAGRPATEADDLVGTIEALAEIVRERDSMIG